MDPVPRRRRSRNRPSITAPGAASSGSMTSSDGPRHRSLGLVEPFQEGPHVRNALGDRRAGGVQDQGTQFGRHLGQVDGQIKAALAVQSLPQRGAVGGGHPAGQHVVGKRAEREDVDPDPVRVRIPHTLGRLERLCHPPVHVGATGRASHHRLRSANWSDFPPLPAAR